MKLTHIQPHDFPILLAMGAIYNEGNYFIPDHLPREPFIPWLPSQVNQLLKPIKLTIELVPQTCWFSNVRSNVSSMDWNRLKKHSAKNAKYHCEICNGQGDRWPVECHEIWEYNDQLLTQRLVGLIALCPPCHRVKHIGLSIKKELGYQAINHLAKVNQWSIEKAQIYINMCFAVWQHRSQFQWHLDINYLKFFGIRIFNSDRNFENNEKLTLTIDKITKIDFLETAHNISQIIRPSKVLPISKKKYFFMLMIIVGASTVIYFGSPLSKTTSIPDNMVSSISINKTPKKSQPHKETKVCEQYVHYATIDGIKTVIKGKACLDKLGRWQAVS